MTPDELDALVLQVVAGQDPTYLILPTASAFVAVDLAPEQVAESFARLEANGHIREDEVVQLNYIWDYVEVPYYDLLGDPIVANDGESYITYPLQDEEGYLLVPRKNEEGAYAVEPALDENGEIIKLAAGWCVTDEGMKLSKTLPPLDELYTPPALPRLVAITEERQQRMQTTLEAINADENLSPALKEALGNMVQGFGS